MRLVSEQIPYRIIPGISSGVGGLAYAGIPMTTRGTNSAVTFVTGHNASGVVPDDIDWKALSDGSPALIFFMGMSHIDRIVEKLKASGRPSSEPVAVIYKATMRDQKVVITTLDNCSKDIASAGLRPPALIVIGEIVNFRNELDWF